MKKIIVDKKFDNKKIVDFMLHSFPHLSINTLYKTLRKKDIKVNGKKVSENIIVFCNDEISIYIPDNLLFPTNLDIVYEDNNIIIVNKPAGIEVTGINSLSTLVQSLYSEALPCHRLDRNTTGLIIFAKNKIALNIILQKFRNKEIEKHYACIVYGIPNKKVCTLNDFLFKDNSKSLVYVSSTRSSGYLPITTKYTVLKENKEKNISLLDVELITGKTHQIRAHLAYAGFPIIGDGKYGINAVNKRFNTTKQLLCSYKIIFNFKTDGGILSYLNKKNFSLNYNFEQYFHI